jgi:hypothetical protein
MDPLKSGVVFSVLVVSLFIIVFRPEDQRARRWAFATVGAMLLYLIGS